MNTMETKTRTPEEAWDEVFAVLRSQPDAYCLAEAFRWKREAKDPEALLAWLKSLPGYGRKDAASQGAAGIAGFRPDAASAEPVSCGALLAADGLISKLKATMTARREGNV